jgi:hypothetical protein
MTELKLQRLQHDKDHASFLYRHFNKYSHHHGLVIKCKQCPKYEHYPYEEQAEILNAIS